jgi:transforming growth factor-beta-induced protein
MPTRYSVLLALGLLQPALCQRAGQLAAAIASYPDLSSFKSLLDSSSKHFDGILSGDSSKNITVLIPTNEAFTKYADNNQNNPVTSLPDSNLTILMQYHIIDAAVTSTTVKAPRGITAPTLLKDTQYNNRSGGAQLAADYGAGAAQGQVLFISPDPINPVRLRVRQATSVSLRGGLAQTGVMQVLDGQWPGGYFQSIDTVLTPPMTCSATISGQQQTLSSLDDALDRTGLWPTLNTAPNVTCLAPSNNAFKEAGNPDTQLNKTDLTSALLYVFPMPFPHPSPNTTP